MLDKIFKRLKIDSGQPNFVHKAGLTMPESLSLGTQKKCPLCVLTGVCIKRVYFSCCRDKPNCPYYPGVCSKRVSIDLDSTVMDQFLPVYLKARLVTSDPSVY